jgi:hypothetical protein
MFGLQVGLSPQGDVMFNPYFIKFWIELRQIYHGKND